MGKLDARLAKLRAVLNARQAARSGPYATDPAQWMTPDYAVAVADILMATGGMALLASAMNVTPDDEIGAALLATGLTYDDGFWLCDDDLDKALAAEWLADADREGCRINDRQLLERRAGIAPAWA